MCVCVYYHYVPNYCKHHIIQNEPKVNKSPHALEFQGCVNGGERCMNVHEWDVYVRGYVYIHRGQMNKVTCTRGHMNKVTYVHKGVYQ